MKIIAALTLAALAYTAHAQTDEITIAPKPKYRKNEIGLLIEPGLPTVTYGSPSGVQYKRWVHPDFGYNLSVTTGNFRFDGDKNFDQVKGDTIYSYQSSTFVPMQYAGIGIHIQRQFFKKVYLYAAIETRVGYGTGNATEMQIREVYKQDTVVIGMVDVNTVQNNKVSIWVLDTTPFIGARLPFRRFTLGAELAAIQAGVARVNINGFAPYSTILGDLTRFRQRFYLAFRF